MVTDEVVVAGGGQGKGFNILPTVSTPSNLPWRGKFQEPVLQKKKKKK